MNIERALLQNADFHLLGPADRSAFAGAMMERRVPKGVDLIVEGKDDDNLYVILTGEGEITLRPESASEVSVLGVLGPGSLIGLVLLIAPGPRSSTCTAVTDLVVGVLPRSAFTLLYSTSSAFSLRFRYIVARQVARDLHRMGDLIRAGAPSTS